MKTFGNLINTTKAMAIIAMTTTAAVLGFTSCTQEDDFCEPLQQETFEFENDVEAEDSLESTDRDFVYDDFGTSSPKQYIQGLDEIQYSQYNRAIVGEVFSIVKNLAVFVTNNYDKITKKPGQTAVQYVLSQVLNTKGPNVMGELQTMNMKLAGVENILHGIDQKLNDMEYSKIFEERLRNLITLRSHNATFLASYYQHLEAGDTVTANRVLDDWQRVVINKNNVDYTTKEFLTLTPYKNNSNQLDITQIYDYWIFQTTPWEHMGYDKRDELRQGDIITAFAGYALTKAYWEKDKRTDRRPQIEELTKAFEDFCEFYKDKETVKRHNDRIVCQIKGANIVFKKSTKVRDMLSHPWFPDNTSMRYKSLAQFMYGDKGVQRITSATALKRSLTKEEAKAIYDYYNSPDNENIPNIKSKSGNKHYSLEEILKSVGFNLSGLEEGKMHVMTLNDDCHKESESAFNDNYHLYYDNVVIANNADKPFESNWKVGTMWIINKHLTKSAVNYDVLKNWNHYDSYGTQFFYTNIESRYTGMKPFPEKK